MEQGFHRGSGGTAKVLQVANRASHGTALKSEVEGAFGEADRFRDGAEAITEDQLRALGTVITLEGADPAFPLRINSLQRFTTHQSPQPQWLLLSVTQGNSEKGLPERAVVWVSDIYRSRFLKLFEDYLSKESVGGQPRNRELIANIARIRTTVARDLWQSSGDPQVDEVRWWEVWLRPASDGFELLKIFARTQDVRVSPRSLTISDRIVTWVEASWSQLELLPFTAVPVAEIRRPEFTDTVEDLPPGDQDEFVADLTERLRPAQRTTPAVVHLDSGVARTHVLLEGSLHEGDLHTVVGVSGFDRDGHGTAMAGVALFGDLDAALSGTGDVVLRHGLESVKIFPASDERPHDPITYGDVTARAVATPEALSQRRRVFCMPITHQADSSDRPGAPTLWSATVDALAVGVGVVRDGDEISLLGVPDAAAARLIVVSTGNVGEYRTDHLQISDLAPAEDPSQAWNALSVGAYTNMSALPTDPQYAGWTAVAPPGELSPHSRTSLLFGNRPWPIKPDVVFEGGNVLTDGSLFETKHPVVSLRTTGLATDRALTSANATSAAAAQASRLAALVMSSYPSYWPETVRGLISHGAEWTPQMREQINAVSSAGLEAKQRVLRRYGWGVPSEASVLYSTNQAVTLVVQDSFVPFVGTEYAMPAFRLHRLPWPRSDLAHLDAADVTLRVTLSYFVEPTASRRGWRQRYSYASHGLRFELQDPLEDEQQFLERINHESNSEEGGASGQSSSQVDWLLGSRNRHYGSLHQDIWETSGQELAQTGTVAVYPVGGWWKNNRNKERLNLPVRYALIVSLKTPESEVDLYTPIATALGVPIATEIAAT